VSTRIQDILFWLLCIGAVLVNAAIFRVRASEYAAGEPLILKEADRILRAFVLYLGGLLMLLVVGTALGLTGSLHAGGQPGSLTAFDVVYLVLNVAVFARATWWVYLQGGAELLAEHHEMFRICPSTRVGVMLLWALAMFAFVCAIFAKVAGTA
jgi:hypothetical protein